LSLQVTDTVEHIKERIEEKEGIPPVQQVRQDAAAVRVAAPPARPLLPLAAPLTPPPFLHSG